jgi:uncharacterized protein GlcG (DUF336 family)
MTPLQQEGEDMYQKPMLSLSQCQEAMRAMVAEFNKDPNRRPVDMAIVDDLGNLLVYARMDRCVRPTFALRKAYTAAIRRMDTGAFAEQLKSQGRSVADFGDPQLVTLQGGLVIHAQDGSLLGGIGVGGLPSGKEDEDIARAGLKALGV